MKENLKKVLELIQHCTSTDDFGAVKATLYQKELDMIEKLLEGKSSPKEDTANSRVEHPNYYKLPNGIECKDVIQYFDWNTGSAIKYLWRNGKKSEEGMTNKEKAIEDLEKAIECTQFEIELLKSEL